MSRILLEAANLQKAYGEQVVLNIDRICIHDGERIALIGENGAGKSTLLAVLTGEIKPDAGTVKHYCPFAMIHQSEETRVNGSARLISEFNAPDLHDGLSGGEMTRRRITQALSEDAPLLFADEPTTDLDTAGIDRLKQFLLSYQGALLLVSHDRALLNALCTRVLHLEDGSLHDFPGSYSDYQAELHRKREFQQFEYDQYRTEKARLKAMAQQKAEWAASVKKAPKRMGNSEARLHTRENTNAVLHQSAAKKIVQNRIDRLEKKERPRDLPDISMTLGVASPIGAKNVLTVRCDCLRAGQRSLMTNARFTLPTGSRTALMGANGSGKTTLLRTLWGNPSEGTAFQGSIQFNPGAKIGCFDQDHAKMLDLHASVLNNVMEGAQYPEAMVRTVLARLNVCGDNVFKPVHVLSGGERTKIALAKLLLSDINFLMLDEPTNHLDVFTMEALETLLRDYGGTLLFVSHDRAFVKAVANRIIRVENGGLVTVEGTLEQMEADLLRNRSEESVRMEIAALEMRMAALAARMSAHKKGDRPQQLNAEYEALAAQLREWKNK